MRAWTLAYCFFFTLFEALEDREGGFGANQEVHGSMFVPRDA